MYYLERNLNKGDIVKLPIGDSVISFKYIEFVKKDIVVEGISKRHFYFKLQAEDDFTNIIWVDHDLLDIGLLLVDYQRQKNNGIYSEDYLIKKNILEKHKIPLLDFNNIPPLTQKQIDDFEPERLRLEQEIREYEEQQLENFKKNNKKNSKIFCFLKEKKKRCKKE